jgi:predicted NBD/HSP70 family sugar kinase
VAGRATSSSLGIEAHGPTDAGARRRARRRPRHARDSLAVILRLVRSGRAETRQEIEVESGLGRAVVAERIGTLLSLGLLEEGDLRESTGGRAPHQVRFRDTAGHVLVGSLGSTTLGVGLADLSGRLLMEHHEPGDLLAGPERTLDRLDALFEWLLEEHPEARNIWGIALSVPGPVELPLRHLASAPILGLISGWRGYRVGEHLSRSFNAPVLVDNEAHLMALGELHAGRGSGRDDLLFLKVGIGISAALCSGGHVQRGAHGYAGDIGHVCVDEDSKIICRCGNTGCLEVMAGGAAIAREGQRAAADGRSPMLAEVAASGRQVTAADVGIASQRGDPVSLELLARSGRLIGTTLATLVNAMNPSLVVVGGGVAQAGEILLAAMREALYRHSRSVATEDLNIVLAEMGKTASLVGGALAVVDQLLAQGYLAEWIDLGAPVWDADGVEAETAPSVVRSPPPRRRPQAVR